MALDRNELLALLTGKVWPRKTWTSSFSMVLGTWLAHRALGNSGLRPLSPDELKPAVTALQDGLKGPLAEELEQSVSGIADPEQAQLAAGLLRGALGLLRREIGRINLVSPIDPRYVGGLVISREGEPE